MRSRAEQQAFSKKLKLFDKGELGKGKMLRQRQREFANIENKLVQYIELRERRYEIDKCGISWCTLCNKALQYASALGYSSDIFHASDGWISKVLERHNKKGINLRGEANDMTTEEREKIMAEWRPQFHTLLEKYDIPPSRVYNGDQTGLYYQKLLNRMYVDSTSKKNTQESNR